MTPGLSFARLAIAGFVAVVMWAFSRAESAL
jgi:hypothetical protein